MTQKGNSRCVVPCRWIRCYEQRSPSYLSDVLYHTALHQAHDLLLSIPFTPGLPLEDSGKFDLKFFGQVLLCMTTGTLGHRRQRREWRSRMQIQGRMASKGTLRWRPCRSERVANEWTARRAIRLLLPTRFPFASGSCQSNPIWVILEMDFCTPQQFIMWALGYSTCGSLLTHQNFTCLLAHKDSTPRSLFLACFLLSQDRVPMKPSAISLAHSAQWSPCRFKTYSRHQLFFVLARPSRKNWQAEARTSNKDRHIQHKGNQQKT